MDTTVTLDADRSRFTISVDGVPAGHLDYARDGDLWALTHTEVDPDRREKGLGEALVLGALEAVDEAGGQVLPLCPYVPSVLARHPEHVHLVPPDQRARFGLA